MSLARAFDCARRARSVCEKYRISNNFKLYHAETELLLRLDREAVSLDANRRFSSHVFVELRRGEHKMPQPLPVSTVSSRPAMAPFNRLDSILASAEEALARAEEQLRRTQQARMRRGPQFTFNASVLERYPKETRQR